MKYTYQYVTDEEKTNIIAQNADKTLIEEQYLLVPIKANYLIFTDTPTVETQLKDIKNNTNMLILKQEGII